MMGARGEGHTDVGRGDCGEGHSMCCVAERGPSMSAGAWEGEGGATGRPTDQEVSKESPVLLCVARV